MFHSELLARVIHADRVRDLERAAESHRLVAEGHKVDPAPPISEAAAPRPSVVATSPSEEAPARVGGSTGLAA